MSCRRRGPGAVALLRGPYADGLPLGVLDLETTGFRTVVPDGEDLDVVSLTRDGTGLWVYDLPWSNPPQPGGSIRVSRVNVDDGSLATIYDEPVVVDDLTEYYNWWVNNRGGIVEMPNGDIVFGTPDGLLIGPADGSAFRRLEAPGDACAIVDAWDDETIQLRCQLPDPPVGCDCGPAGLWLVPTDGSAGRALAIPEVGSCTTYSRATPLGDDLAISAGFGSGECNSGVLLDLGDGLDAWVPPISEVDCNESLLGHAEQRLARHRIQSLHRSRFPGPNVRGHTDGLEGGPDPRQLGRSARAVGRPISARVGPLCSLCPVSAVRAEERCQGLFARDAAGEDDLVVDHESGGGHHAPRCDLAGVGDLD